MLAGCVKKLSLCPAGVNYTDLSILETNINTSQKIRLSLSYNPLISYLSIYYNGSKTLQKRHFHSYVCCSTIHTCQNLETLQVSMNR